MAFGGEVTSSSVNPYVSTCFSGKDANKLVCLFGIDLFNMTCVSELEIRNLQFFLPCCDVHYLKHELN